MLAAALGASALLFSGFLLPAAADEPAPTPVAERSAPVVESLPSPLAPAVPAAPAPEPTLTPTPAPTVNAASGAADVIEPAPTEPAPAEPAPASKTAPEPTVIRGSEPDDAPQPSAPEPTPSPIVVDPDSSIPPGLVAAANETPKPRAAANLLEAASALKDTSYLSHASRRAGEWKDADRTVEPGTPRAYAVTQLGQYGWSLNQWQYLDRLWWHESNWNYKSGNPSSGAYGIPQALPPEKMASAGKDWKTNYKTQIDWGMNYIKSRYGSPKAALAFWGQNNWY